MTFTSVAFLLFVLACLVIYYCFPKKYQWTVLLAASYTFYLITSYRYVAFLIITTITTFLSAIFIEKISDKSKAFIAQNKGEWDITQKKAYKEKTKKKKRAVLACVLLFNFGILFVLKYYNFFAGSLGTLFTAMHFGFTMPSIKLFLPLGISFYTFQSMGYAIDVYRGKTRAEKNFAKLALFVSFFPQIVQGPISIYNQLAHQLYESHKLNYENIKYGAQLVMWGFFKKVVIADRAVKIVSAVSADYQSYNGVQIALAIITYSFQLYADFSGGIDITRGVAQMFGIDMAQNFRQPYFSKSISEYWRRWHITLGAWLKEYLFYPIAMSKAFLSFGKKLKPKFGNQFAKIFPTSIASLITFVVIGIWHGANWKFVAFGFWNGLIIMISTLLEPSFKKFLTKAKIRTDCFSYRLFQMIRTYIIIVIGLVFDIAPSFKGAINMMKLSFTDFNPSCFLNKSMFTKTFLSFGLSIYDYAIIFMGFVIMLIVGILRENNGCRLREEISKQNIWFQWLLMFACIVAVIVLGVYGPGSDPAEFVYMQF